MKAYLNLEFTYVGIQVIIFRIHFRLDYIYIHTEFFFVELRHCQSCRIIIYISLHLQVILEKVKTILRIYECYMLQYNKFY